MADLKVERTQRGALPGQAEAPEMMGLGDEGEWQPASNLPTPPARPGYEQKWVRIKIRSEDDSANYHKAFNEGWRPRTDESGLAGFSPQKITQGQFAGYIGTHDLVLMEIPVALKQKIDAYYQGRINDLQRSVDSDILKVQSRDVPFTQDRRTSTSRGRVPTLAD